MSRAMRCLLWILSGCIPVCLSAQVTIRGEIKDRYSGDTLSNVNVRNIYTQKGMTVKPDGKFELVVRKGELVEFTCVGYQTVRLRIQSEKEPLYFYITMEKIPVMLREVDIRGKPLDFKKDSIRYEETYHLVLHKQRMEDMDMRSMPLAMLSKKNRQEWAFQKMYAQWEQEKYIDYMFNEKLVSKITYLKGDTLQAFMKRYRPTYEFIRNAGDYEYLDYIKYCYVLFRQEGEQP